MGSLILPATRMEAEVSRQDFIPASATGSGANGKLSILIPVQSQKREPCMSHFVEGRMFPRQAGKMVKTDFIYYTFFSACTFQPKHFPHDKMQLYPMSEN